MENENDILYKIPSDMPAGPYLLGYAQAIHDLNKNWDIFRREAAKDILCAITANNMVGNDAHYKLMAQEAIKQADELIKVLQNG